MHGALTGASPLAAAADSLASLADKGVASTPIVPLRVLKKKFAADEEVRWRGAAHTLLWASPALPSPGLPSSSAPPPAPSSPCQGLAKAMEKLAAAGLEVPADDMTGEDMAKWEANDHPLPYVRVACAPSTSRSPPCPQSGVDATSHTCASSSHLRTRLQSADAIQGRGRSDGGAAVDPR